MKEQTVTQVQKTCCDQHVMVERTRSEDASLGALKKPVLQKASFHEEDGTAKKTGKAEMDAKPEQEECDMTFCKEL